MLTVAGARVTDRKIVEKLIAEYHVSEQIVPNKKRIAWAVDQQLSGKSEGLLLVAREDRSTVGVALAVFTPSAELGRVLTVNDFFVSPEKRRRGAGRKLALYLVMKCRQKRVDEIVLEVLHDNLTAAKFWCAMGFERSDRFLFRQKLRKTFYD